MMYLEIYSTSKLLPHSVWILVQTKLLDIDRGLVGDKIRYQNDAVMISKYFHFKLTTIPLSHHFRLLSVAATFSNESPQDYHSNNFPDRPA